MQLSDSAGITVAGTQYVPATTMPFKRYGYIMGQVWALDLSSVSNGRAMLARVFESGRGGALFAGFYVPVVDGVAQKWDADRAARIATEVDESCDLGVLTELTGKILGLLSDFFPGVANSSPSFATSSDSTTTTLPSTSEVPTSEPLGETHSGSSDSSSEPLLATTSTDTPEFCAGMSAKD